MTTALKPVLLLGGSGVVGSRAVAALRRLQPDLPIAIGGRDLARASAVAQRAGNATALKVDLDRADLGAPAGAAFSAVVTLLKDETLNSMKYAQAHGLPYVSFSDYLFEIGPEVALYVQAPTSAPILFLGHALGGAVTVSALHFARELRSIDTLDVAVVVYDDDHGGPAAHADIERGGRVPNTLLRKGGRWIWASGDDAERTVTAADGTEHRGRAYPLLDVVSLAAATDAPNVRLDLVVRSAASRPAGKRPSTEMIFELDGVGAGGEERRVRHEIADDEDLSTLSARGLALAVERLLGLAGGPPVAPGLYNPETILHPADVVQKLEAFGARIARDVRRG
ncbi:hypothetical protein WMF31_12895 [Sorangium sp. So ce1036]|uniref:hypothetical protein n=1 Tax=Sorangium sp. So ce1036 TaxID=3133328 RepID=UPI003EFBCAB3